MRALVLNGPNLDMLGTREPEIYGSATLAEVEARIGDWGEELGIEVDTMQTNHEGELIEAVHGSSGLDGLVVNPGALTHTSRALADAIAAGNVPTVEVHISDIKGREPWRAVSHISEACVYTIYGRGVEGYRHALRHLVNRAALPFSRVRYGPHADHVADLRLPPAAARGLVILAHGGFWLDPWTRDTTETLALALTEAGFATLNVEYRRLGDGGGWPGSAQDLLMALDFTSLVDELSGLAVAMVGHSAGAHSALWAAPRSRRTRPRLVVGLAPVTDLEALAASTGPEAEAASSLIDAGAPPRVDSVSDDTLLVHGEEDRHVSPQHSRRLARAARVTLVPGLGHFHLLDPGRAHWPAVLSALEEALG